MPNNLPQTKRVRELNFPHRSPCRKILSATTKQVRIELKGKKIYKPSTRKLMMASSRNENGAIAHSWVIVNDDSTTETCSEDLCSKLDSEPESCQTMSREENLKEK